MSQEIPQINVPLDELRDFCKRWEVVELALFGSVLRENFSTHSDVDVLISFSPKAQWSLFDLVRMRDELKSIFKHEVDLVEKSSLVNPFRRREILSTCRTVYAA